MVQLPFGVDMHLAISIAHSSSMLGSKDSLLALHHAAQQNFVIYVDFIFFGAQLHAQIADKCPKKQKAPSEALYLTYTKSQLLGSCLLFLF